MAMRSELLSVRAGRKAKSRTSGAELPFRGEGYAVRGSEEDWPHLLVVFSLVAILLTGAPVALKNFLVDLRFNSFPRQASGDVVILAIDSPSIEAIGVWPWPRRVHAELIDKLLYAGVTGIAFDVDFSTPSTAEFDRAFAEALQRAGGSVILPSFEQLVNSNNRKTIYLNRPLRNFAEHAWSAIVNVSADPDCVVRRYPFGDMVEGKFLPSMGSVLVGRYGAGQTAIMDRLQHRTGIGAISPTKMSCRATPVSLPDLETRRCS